jgi:nuclear transport factor 2 (NTF2) superfamily protein
MKKEISKTIKDELEDKHLIEIAKDKIGYKKTLWNSEDIEKVDFVYSFTIHKAYRKESDFIDELNIILDDIKNSIDFEFDYMKISGGIRLNRNRIIYSPKIFLVCEKPSERFRKIENILK